MTPPPEPGRPARRRGARGREAELLLARWLRAQGWLVHLAAPSGVRRLRNGAVVCQQHDLFGVFDALALRAEPLVVEDPAILCVDAWLLQVTTAGGRTERRRRIEAAGPALPRSTGWRVSLVSHERTPHPGDRRRTAHHWRVEDYVHGLGWQRPVVFAFEPATLALPTEDA